LNSILIDTNFYADIMLGKDHAVKVIHQTEEIIMCPIVLGELLHGFKNGRQERKNLDQLNDFFQLSSVHMTPLTEKTSEFFALIAFQLKKAGTPIPTNDLWIAACAMEHGSAVATSDNHFQKISGLLII